MVPRNGTTALSLRYDVMWFCGAEVEVLRVSDDIGDGDFSSLRRSHQRIEFLCRAILVGLKFRDHDAGRRSFSNAGHASAGNDAHTKHVDCLKHTTASL